MKSSRATALISLLRTGVHQAGTDDATADVTIVGDRPVPQWGAVHVPTAARLLVRP